MSENNTDKQIVRITQPVEGEVIPVTTYQGIDAWINTGFSAEKEAVEGEVVYADETLARMKQFVKEMNRKIALEILSLEVEPEIVDLENPVRVRRLK